MATTASRPWYRLHWVTWLPIVLVTASFIEAQCETSKFGAIYGGFPGVPSYCVHYYGWPLIDLESTMSSGSESPQIDLWYSRVAVNLATGILLLVSTAWCFESVVRRPRPHQFTVSNLLTLTAAVAVFLTLIEQETAIKHWIHPPGRLDAHFYSIANWRDCSNPFRACLILGVICTVFAAVRLLARLPVSALGSSATRSSAQQAS